MFDTIPSALPLIFVMFVVVVYYIVKLCRVTLEQSVVSFIYFRSAYKQLCLNLSAFFALISNSLSN